MKTVLVVDDHLDTRIICRELLGYFGYSVQEASNGAEALVQAEAVPDLILLDLLMPDRDGLSVLAELRARDSLSATPIVVYTAAASQAAELRAHPMVTRVLLKPLEAKILLQAVHELIGPAEPELPA